MTPDSDPHRAPDRRDLVAVQQPRHPQHLYSGGELVALAERFEHAVFTGAVGFVGASTLMALAFLPLRESAENGEPPLSAVAAALAVLVATGLAFWRANDLNRLLRRHPELNLVGVLIAAVLLSVVSPLRNELWWSACAILMVIALQVSLRQALLYCLIVLLANLSAHVVSGDISAAAPVSIVGLWVGLPFWMAVAAVVPDRMASYILRVNTLRSPSRPPPRKISVESRRSGDMDLSDGVAHDPTDVADRPHAVEEQPAPTPPSTADPARLTARQLEVVALLVDGHRYEEISACLSISAGQVYRHVRNATERLDVDNVNELVSVAVELGLVPAPARRASRVNPAGGPAAPPG